MATVTLIKTGKDDPRICLACGTGLIRVSSIDTTCVAVSLHRKQADVEPIALHACSASEARDLAMEIWKMAEAADRHNEAEQARKEGI